jgi:hypothetical protein
MRYLVVIALLAAFPMATYAGRCKGSAMHKDVVRKGYVDTYRECFDKDEVAVVTAVGDGDIDIFVYDKTGNLLVHDVEADGTPACVWRPKYTGIYSIQIRNCAGKDIHYTIRIL